MTEPAAKKSRSELRKEKWQTFKKALPDAAEIARPHARLWALGLVLLVISRLCGLVLPAAPKILLDEAVPARDFRLMMILIGAIVVSAVINALCTFALTQTVSKAGQRTIASLRQKIHRHVTRLSLKYYDAHKTGEVVSRVMNDVEGVRNLVGTGVIEFIGGLMTAALAFCILLYLNWQMTALIVVFLLLFAIVMVKAFAVMGPIFKERQKAMGDVSGRLTESINGVRVVKAYDTEDIERSQFAKGIDALLQTVLRTINAISSIGLASTLLIGLLGASVMFVGGSQLMSGELKAGAFVSYILYMGFMVAPISAIVMVGTQLSEAFAGIERMKEVLGVEPEDADEDRREPIGPVRGEVEFRGVGFEYEAGKPVLHDISFAAPVGKVTALVGPSGSGKSTLIGLVAAFYQPTSGTVLVDGRDLAKVRLHDFRKQLGCVLQDNFLFAGTIRENILYARPSASDAEMKEAARLARCDEFIDRFELGYETIIGERGVKLSGGQRQRVAIARALLADPRILILDEATSNLDSESEAFIQEGLGKLMAGRTTFVIAHRLSTIRSADQILVLEGGRIVERGTHEELLAARGRYFDMYSMQYGMENSLFSSAPPEPEAADEPGEPRRGFAGLMRGV